MKKIICLVFLPVVSCSMENSVVEEARLCAQNLKKLKHDYKIVMPFVDKILGCASEESGNARGGSDQYPSEVLSRLSSSKSALEYIYGQHAPLPSYVEEVFQENGKQCDAVFRNALASGLDSGESWDKVREYLCETVYPYHCRTKIKAILLAHTQKLSDEKP